MRYINTYDTEGNIISSRDTFYGSFYEAKYNDKNQMIHRNTDNNIVFSLKYNAAGLISEELIYRIDPRKREKDILISKESYRYFSNGLIFQKIENDRLISEYTYNSKGSLTSYIKYLEDEVIFYEDFTLDHLEREIVYSNSKGEWRESAYLHDTMQQSKFELMKKTVFSNSYGYEEIFEYNDARQQTFHRTNIHCPVSKGDSWKKRVFDDYGNLFSFTDSTGKSWVKL